MTTSNITVKGVPGYDDHEVVYQIHIPEERIEGFIAIHRKHNGHPSFGATRFLNYRSDVDALTDVLRLSHGMTLKCKGAELPYGGGKCVLRIPKGKFNRKQYFEAYAGVINSLNGLFITGADVGVNMADVVSMRRKSQYIVGVDVDPVKYTAIGVCDAVHETLLALGKKEDLSDITIAIQGVGKTGAALLEYLYPHKPKIYITDVDTKRSEEMSKKYPGVIRVEADDIYDVPATIFSPCAVGGVLNSSTIARLHVEAVVGSANNQLLSPADADQLKDKNILYAPDFIVNAGGLVSVVYEFEHPIGNSDEGIQEKVKGIRTRLHRIYTESKKTRQNTHAVAQKFFQ